MANFIITMIVASKNIFFILSIDEYIMKSVEAYLEGRVSVGPATLYTNLSKLVDAGLCVFTEVSNKKVYEITTLGKTVLDQEVEKRRRILAFMENQMEKALEKGVNL